MLNLTRTGIAAAVGAGSGAIDAMASGQIDLMGQKIQHSTLEEAGALLVGAALQILMPHRMTDVVDGLVDGSIALLARRGTAMVAKKPAGAAAWGLGAYGSPYAMGFSSPRPLASSMGRPAIGNISAVSKRKLT